MATNAQAALEGQPWSQATLDAALLAVAKDVNITPDAPGLAAAAAAATTAATAAAAAAAAAAALHHTAVAITKPTLCRAVLCCAVVQGMHGAPPTHLGCLSCTPQARYIANCFSPACLSV